MESLRSFISFIRMPTGIPARAREAPSPRSSRELLNDDCWREIGKRLSARDVVHLSQIDRNLRGVFPPPRNLINMLVERYYDTAKQRQNHCRTTLGQIPFSGSQGKFEQWLATHLPKKEDHDWLNADILRLRALFRYLSTPREPTSYSPTQSGPAESLITCMVPLSGDRLTSGAIGRQLKLWDLTRPAGKECVATLSGHTGSISCLRAINKERLVSGATDSTLKIWDLTRPEQPECIATLSGHTHLINCIAVLPNAWLASSSRDRTIRIWDLSRPQGQECIDIQSKGGNILCIENLPNGRQVIGLSCKLEICDLSQPTRQESITLVGHQAQVRCLIALPNGLLASGSYDRTVKIWDPSQTPGQECIATLTHGKAVIDLALLFDGRLVVAIENHHLAIWDITRPPCSQHIITLLHRARYWLRAVVQLDGRLLSPDLKRLQVWDLNNLIDDTKTLPH